MEPTPVRRLYRSATNRVIFGVCGGLGEYFAIDPIIFRILFIALVFGAGTGVLLYLILALVVPKAPSPAGGISGTVADKINLNERVHDLASELKQRGVSGSRRMWLGGVIVLIGLFLLLEQFFPMHFFRWGIFWAVAIIAVGFFIMTRKSAPSPLPSVSPKWESPKFAPAAEALPKEVIREIHHHHDRGGGLMRLFLGLLLVLIGSIVLAQNFGYLSDVNLNFEQLWRFWPVFVILIGLSLMSRGTRVGGVLSIVMVIAIVVVVVVSLFWPGHIAEPSTYLFDIPQDPLAGRAEVFIKAGASTVNLLGGAIGVVSGGLESNVTRLATSTSTSNGTQRVTLGMENGTFRLGPMVNTLTVNFSEVVPLALSLDAGASNIDADLSALLLEELKIYAGASSLDVKFGDRATTTNAEIEAGASAMEFSLPKGLGARLDVDASLASKNFADLVQVSDRIYESANYASSTKKLNLKLDAGVSSIDIRWR